MQANPSLLSGLHSLATDLRVSLGGVHAVTGYFDRDKDIFCLTEIYDGRSGLTLPDADYAVEAG